MASDLESRLRDAMHQQVGGTFAPVGVLDGVLRRHRRHRGRVLLSSAGQPTPSSSARSASSK